MNSGNNLPLTNRLWLLARKLASFKVAVVGVSAVLVSLVFKDALVPYQLEWLAVAGTVLAPASLILGLLVEDSLSVSRRRRLMIGLFSIFVVAVLCVAVLRATNTTTIRKQRGGEESDLLLLTTTVLTEDGRRAWAEAAALVCSVDDPPPNCEENYRWSEFFNTFFDELDTLLGGAYRGLKVTYLLLYLLAFIAFGLGVAVFNLSGEDKARVVDPPPPAGGGE